MKIKALVLIMFVMIITQNTFAQENSFSKSVGFNLGLTVQGWGLFGLSFVTEKYIFSASMVGPLASGTEGPDYSGSVNWDEFPEDVIEEGIYAHSIDFGFGYLIKKKYTYYIMALIGKGVITEYRNCYDDFHILGNNGSYHKTRSKSSELNFGAEVGLIRGRFSISIFHSYYAWTGIKVSYNLLFD